MIKSLKAIKGTLTWDCVNSKELTNLKQINVLIGGNGAGKTTWIKGIINGEVEIFTDKEIKVFKYDNEKNFKNINIPLHLVSDGLDYLLHKTLACSEGQMAMISISSFLEYVKENLSKDKTNVILLDEVDTGMGSDTVNALLWEISDLLMYYDEEIQLFISSNNYHWIYFFKYGLDIVNNKWEKINSYDEYYSILEKNHKKILDKNTDFIHLGKYENNPCCEIVFDDIEVNIIDKEK